MENIKGNFVILNGIAVPLTDYQPVSGSGFIYEVIRVLNGKFLFLNDHLKRLIDSCSKSDLIKPKYAALEEALAKLLQHESSMEGNVKLNLFHTEEEVQFVCYYIHHFYPTKEEYQQGVIVKSFRFERPDPSIKRWNDPFRADVRRFIQEEKIYEAVLINQSGYLTEGSRSNLFYIDQDGVLITTPEEYILAGITRKHILQICKELGININERLLSLKEAEQMTACFISGTSPMVLPVSKLNEISFDVKHPIIHKILEKYLQLAGA